jgi:tRNA(fMet)-specific endonuclease VapC
LTLASGRFLLDTNIVIALLEGNETVLSNLDQAPEVFIPAVALGELFFGAAKSGRPSENMAKVERFAAGRAIVSCDLDVAREIRAFEAAIEGEGASASRERYLDSGSGETSRDDPHYPRPPLQRN